MEELTSSKTIAQKPTWLQKGNWKTKQTFNMQSNARNNHRKTDPTFLSQFTKQCANHQDRSRKDSGVRFVLAI